MAYLLGIDLGTSSVKALLMDITGNVLSNASEKYPVIRRIDGWAEQDPEIWWKSTAKVIKQVVSQSGVDAALLKGIGLSGQMHGLVAIDENGRVIRPAIIWMDSRSVSECGEIYQTIGEAQFSEISLNPASPGFLLPSLLWIKKHEPENYERISKVLFPKDYIRYKLTQTMGTDYSDASGSMAFDTANICWSSLIIGNMGIDSNLFPTCHNAHSIAGYVHASAAEQCSLARGTPVVYGGGDQLMQSVGNGVISPGVVSSNIGTASQISSPTNSVKYDDKMRINTFCHVIGDMWNLVGASLNGGICIQWFLNQFAKDKSLSDFDLMVNQVRPASDGLIFLPYLSGERTPHLDPAARGVFFGIGLNHTLNHFARAVMEGATYALKDSLELLKSMGIRSDKIVASGGGAMSSEWLQIQADIFDSEIYTTVSSEQACLGAAIIAGYGVGVYKSLQEACENLIRFRSNPITPNQANVTVYNEMYSIYREIYKRDADLFCLIQKGRSSEC